MTSGHGETERWDPNRFEPGRQLPDVGDADRPVRGDPYAGTYADGRYGDGRYDPPARYDAPGGRPPAGPPSDPPRLPVGQSVDAKRLWSSALATAIVAALIALVGVLIVRALLQIAVHGSSNAGALGDSSTLLQCVFAALAALGATALAHLLMLTTPQPMIYFTWIVGLVTAAATLTPLIGDAPVAERVALAIINLVIGIAIGSLVTGAVMSARRRPVDDDWD